MSYFFHDPDEWETVVESHVCSYHQGYPRDKMWGGCSCSWSSGQRRRPAEEVLRIKAERRRKEEDDILAQAEMIKLRRQMSAP